MPLQIRNIFTSADTPPVGDEIMQVLASGSDVHIERIVSRAHATPAGEWYDQDHDEWVMLLRGKASLELDDGNILPMQPGDYVFLPAHTRHRVAATSDAPPAVWLAIHGILEAE